MDGEQAVTMVQISDRFHGLDDEHTVNFYENEFYPLSNFSAFQVQWCNAMFPTSEHAYQWSKFLADGNPTIAHQIRYAPSAHEAFKIAERNKDLRRSDWDEAKLRIMEAILRAKHEQHEYVRRKLLQTGGRQLVENSWRDDFWGIGPKGDGQNHLGRLWMKIRDEVVSGYRAAGQR